MGSSNDLPVLIPIGLSDGAGPWNQGIACLPVRRVLRFGGHPIDLEYENGVWYADSGWSVVGMGETLQDALRDLQQSAEDHMEFLIDAGVDLTVEDCRFITWCARIQDEPVDRLILTTPSTS